VLAGAASFLIERFIVHLREFAMTARIRMLPAAAVLLAVAAFAVAQTGTAPPVVYLWPKGAPGFENRKDEKENTTFTKNGIENTVKNVNNPSITVYLPPKEKATGAAIVICPGGGHSVLGANSEGHAVGKWLADHGIAGFVLKYRLEREKGSPYKIEVHALQDGQRAIRTVRANAKEWGVDPKRVGIIGFSAGGEVVGYASTRFDMGKPDSEDVIERQGSRPDFQVLIYSGPLGVTRGPAKGDPPPTLTKDTPPAFIAIGEKDNMAVAMANHFIALKKAGVSTELYIFAGAGHAFNLSKDAKWSPTVQGWPLRLTEWMAGQGFLKQG
jgi:endo-1,4-beta-xylanase